MVDVTEYERTFVGDWAPWFSARTVSGGNLDLDALSGIWTLLLFVGSSAAAGTERVMAAIEPFESSFSDGRVRLVCVTSDPRDEGRVSDRSGRTWLLDRDLVVARSFGAVPPMLAPKGEVAYRPSLFLLDPQLRMHAGGPIGRLDEILRLVARLPDPEDHAGIEMHAPVLIVPRVFEPELCLHLVGLHESGDVRETGVTRLGDGLDDRQIVRDFKRRRDHDIVDNAVIAAVSARIDRRLVGPIQRAFQFAATRIERHIVACYDSADGGMFLPHRDNTSPGTAHRRFAVSINLNDDFDGGGLVFPEFGPRRYKAPVGAAVVFGCGLQHSVTPVTAGRRFAYLPFLYDAAAEALLKDYVALQKSNSEREGLSDRVHPPS